MDGCAVSHHSPTARSKASAHRLQRFELETFEGGQFVPFLVPGKASPRSAEKVRKPWWELEEASSISVFVL